MVESLALDEVWMFGSCARDESNRCSDVDVLVVSDDAELPATTIDCLLKKFGRNMDVAHYSYRGLQALADQGSLFAWHLRYEGVPLYRKVNRLETILDDMEPYARHVEDLEVLLTVFDDALASLPNRAAVQFDLGIVATVVRNTGIIMHDLLGGRDFSPAAPTRLSSISDAPMLPIDENDYAYLQACRRASERGERVEGLRLSHDSLDVVLEELRRWLCVCINYAKTRGNDHGDRQTSVR